MSRWIQIETLAGGHRLFTRTGSSNVFIADDSGQTPDLTDDGPMWLDRTLPLVAGAKGCVVPVESDRGVYRAVVTPADLLHLSEVYRWSIETDDDTPRMYRSVRVR